MSAELIARAEAAEAYCAELRARMQNVVTTDHESKSDFINRVREIIADIPADMGEVIARLNARADKLEADLAHDREVNEAEAALDQAEREGLRARLAEMNKCVNQGIERALTLEARIAKLVAAGDAMAKEAHERGIITHAAAWDAAKGSTAFPAPSAKSSAFAAGVLIRAGTMQVSGEEVTGLVIKMPRAELEAIRYLPMYQRVSVGVWDVSAHPDKDRLEFIRRQYANAIHYCCRVDGDEWNTDFYGTLERTMQRHADYEARKLDTRTPHTGSAPGDDAIMTGGGE